MKIIKFLLTDIADNIVDKVVGYFHSKKEIALAYMMAHLGAPYVYGGKNMLEGVDCSGLVVEYLRCMGLITNTDDFTAASLFTMYPTVRRPKRGDLVFWRNSKGNISHVEIMLNSEQSIGASGGDRYTVDFDTAIEDDAYVKVNYIYNRDNIAGFSRPK